MEKDQKQIKENYEHLKALLSYGDITNIANNTGFCRGTVYNVEKTLILTTLDRFKLTTPERSMLTTPKRSMLTT